MDGFTTVDTDEMLRAVDPAVVEIVAVSLYLRQRHAKGSPSLERLALVRRRNDLLMRLTRAQRDMVADAMGDLYLLAT